MSKSIYVLFDSAEAARNFLYYCTNMSTLEADLDNWCEQRINLDSSNEMLCHDLRTIANVIEINDLNLHVEKLELF